MCTGTCRVHVHIPVPVQVRMLSLSTNASTATGNGTEMKKNIKFGETRCNTHWCGTYETDMLLLLLFIDFVWSDRSLLCI
jgi:hypothetical protein